MQLDVQACIPSNFESSHRRLARPDSIRCMDDGQTEDFTFRRSGSLQRTVDFEEARAKSDRSR